MAHYIHNIHVLLTLNQAKNSSGLANTKKSRLPLLEVTGSFPGLKFNADGCAARRGVGDQDAMNHARPKSGVHVHGCELLLRRYVHARGSSHHVGEHEHDGIQDGYVRGYVSRDSRGVT